MSGSNPHILSSLLKKLVQIVKIISLQNCQLRYTEADCDWRFYSEQDSGAEVGAETKNQLDLDDGQHCLLPGLGPDTHLPAGGGPYLSQPGEG